jgi:hypothetical protein
MQEEGLKIRTGQFRISWSKTGTKAKSIKQGRLQTLIVILLEKKIYSVMEQKGSMYRGVVLPYSLTVAHFVNKSSVFYGIRVFICAFIRVCRHCTPSWVILFHTTSYHPISVKFRFNINPQSIFIYPRVFSSLHILRLNLCTYFLSRSFQLYRFQQLS